MPLPITQRSDWFLTSAERGNTATSIDRRHGGTAWTVGNSVAPLGHGRRYFRRLHEELTSTTRGDVVLFTDWRGDPDERLAGPGTGVVSVLAGIAARGVRIQGLIWRSHPDQTRFSEQENRGFATAINAAGGHVLLDERVRRAGSHHQKLVVILHPSAPARDVAFVGGIDLCHGRNDDEHHLGDPQAAIMDRRYGPTPAWHDMQVEIHGPAIGDLTETFRERWSDSCPLRRRWADPLHWAASSRVDRPPAASAADNPARPAIGAHAVQVLRTYPVKHPRYPFAPDGERSIARAYAKAFRRARRLIYIEDQYMWSSDVARALGEALEQQPELHVVVVVPRYPDDDGFLSGPPNRIGQLRALRHLHEIGGPRFTVYDLEEGQKPIYVHAKICIVDDVWMTVGSDNLNRRSWTHDSELSCAILDDTLDQREPTDPGGLGDGARLLPRTTRLVLWAEHLQRNDVPVDFRHGMDTLRDSAADLEQWHHSGCRGERPRGRLRRHRTEPVGPLRTPLARLAYRLVSDPDGRPLALRLRRQY